MKKTVVLLSLVLLAVTAHSQVLMSGGTYTRANLRKQVSPSQTPIAQINTTSEVQLILENCCRFSDTGLKTGKKSSLLIDPDQSLYTYTFSALYGAGYIVR